MSKVHRHGQIHQNGRQEEQHPQDGVQQPSAVSTSAADRVAEATVAATDDEVIDPSVGVDDKQAPELEKWRNPTKGPVRLVLDGEKKVPAGKSAMFPVAYHKAIHRQAPQLECPVEQAGGKCEIRARYALTIESMAKGSKAE